MIDLTPLARPYGKALFYAALEAEDLEKTKTSIQMLSNLSITKEVSVLIEDPTKTKKEIAKIIHSLMGESLNTTTSKLLNILAENKRLNLIASVNDSFVKLYEKHNKQTNISVTVASEVADDTKNDLFAKLKKTYGDNISVNFKKDPLIMGGLSIMVGDESFDLSIKGKIKKLINQLNF